jgi:hypothetical protein
MIYQPGFSLPSHLPAQCGCRRRPGIRNDARWKAWRSGLFIVLFKDTSLASIIHPMMDLTKAAQTLSQRELRPFEMNLFIAVIYWVCMYSLSRFSRWLEIRRPPERHSSG